MKRNIANAIIVCLILLSPALSRAEEYVHNFQSMYGTTLSVTNGNKTGTTDLVTYTCSGGSAQFSADLSKSGGNIAIFMEGSGAQVVTSPVIDELDSIRFTYLPASSLTIKVAISTDGSSWTDIEVLNPVNGVKHVIPPVKGPYMVRIKRYDTNFYITEIEYITKACHCLRVVND